MESVQDHALELGKRLREREPEIALAIFQRVQHLVPDGDRDGDPARVESVHSTIQASVDSSLRRIEQGESSPGRLLPGAWENVRIAARNGSSLSTTLQSYVTGHLVNWEFIVEEAEKLDLDDQERIRLLKHVSMLETGHFNELVGLVSDEYMREAQALSQTREQRRAEVIREILTGGSATSDEIGYYLEGEHIGLVITADRPDEIARRVASALDRRVLTVSRSESSGWAWLGGRTRLDARELIGEASALCSDDVKLACGEPSEGVDGFRVTHRQAQAAYAVAQRVGSRVTRYADVALMAFGLSDELLASAFVKLYLGPLDNEPRRGAKLRDTLKAYFTAGQNAASASAALGVHERTVGYRLRNVEDRLGYSINARHAELEVALRIEELHQGAAAPELSPRESSAREGPE
jgi:sugar diacid utilization regulator